jgi:hypothetical protein
MQLYTLQPRRIRAQNVAADVVDNANAKPVECRLYHPRDQQRNALLREQAAAVWVAATVARSASMPAVSPLLVNGLNGMNAVAASAGLLIDPSATTATGAATLQQATHLRVHVGK